MLEENPAAISAVERFGTNSNAFLALYPGYQSFEPKSDAGILFYLETRHCWVGVAEPLCKVEDVAGLLSQFAAAARAKGKKALLLPVSGAVRESALNAGFGGFQIGSEPLFEFVSYTPDFNKVSTARRLNHRGAQVYGFRPDKLNKQQKAALDSLVSDWLDSRKMPELGFVNRVEPWSWSAHKKYFRVELDGKILAFLAAIPIPAVKGWYFIDLFRCKTSPPGSTELLILEAMRLLKEQGARRVSLGVAPLSDLERGRKFKHKVLYQAFNLVYRYGGFFYRFKSLHQFKLKFEPTRSEPSFLIYYPPSLGVGIILGVLEAFLSHPSFTVKGLLRRNFVMPAAVHAVKNAFAVRTVLRGTAHEFEFHARWMPATLCFALALPTLYVLFGTALNAEFSFRIETVRHFELARVLVSPFLHFNSLHCLTNVVLLLFICGIFESLVGTRVFLMIFSLGALSNSLSFLLFDAWNSLHPLPANHFLDVGISLPVFSCLGALCAAPSWFGGWVLAGISAGFILFSFGTGEIVSLNHVTALLVGWGMQRLSFRYSAAL